MVKRIHVLTNPELGWSCVIGAYETYAKALEALASYEGFEYVDIEEIDDYINSHGSMCTIQTVTLNERIG